MSPAAGAATRAPAHFDKPTMRKNLPRPNRFTTRRAVPLPTEPVEEGEKLEMLGLRRLKLLLQRAK